MLITKGTLADLGKLAITVGLGGVAALTPRATRRSLSTGLAAVGRWVRKGELDEAAELTGNQLPEVSEPQRQAIAVEMRTVRIEHALCRGYGVFRRDWPARVTTSGIEHLHAAHAEGRGVVVWVMTFLDLTPFFIVVAAEGYPVTHLSSAKHGMTGKGPISRRIVAPVVLRIERRSQGRRLIIPATGGLDYLRELQSIIEEDHGTVSIRGDYTSGRRMIEAPHLGTVAAFPTGAPSLAHRTGAPLLTAATVRRGPLEHEVIIDEPVAVSRTSDRRTFQYEAVQEFAARLERRARAYPGSRPWPSVAQR